jgi:hypothetical protein
MTLGMCFFNFKRIDRKRGVGVTEKEAQKDLGHSSPPGVTEKEVQKGFGSLQPIWSDRKESSKRIWVTPALRMTGGMGFL